MIFFFLLKLYYLVLYAKLLINMEHREIFSKKDYRHKKKLSKLFTHIDVTN